VSRTSQGITCEERSLQPNRLKIIDGGYCEVAEVELYHVPDSVCEPTAAPTIDRRDGKIVKAVRSRAPDERTRKRTANDCDEARRMVVIESILASEFSFWSHR
jgi:hypothetical protein